MFKKWLTALLSCVKIKSSAFTLDEIHTLMRFMREEKIDAFKYSGLELFKSRHDYPIDPQKNPQTQEEIDQLIRWSAK
jgi:hypothetical protein